MTATPLEFWFEFASTYSHIAAQRIEGLAASKGVEVHWRVFLLGPIFAAQGWNDSPFNLYPSKGAYMWRDMERECARHGVPFRRPTAFPRSGLIAARLVVAADGAPWLPAFIRAVYLANFFDDRDITRVEVLQDLLAGAGCDAPDAALAAAQSPEVKQQLRERNERAVARGVFGAPSFFVGDELFWGSDRMEQALELAAGGG